MVTAGNCTVVIPAKAGIQSFLDSRLHGNDKIWDIHHAIFINLI